MLDRLLKGSPLFYIWLVAIGGLIAIGGVAYIVQLIFGLSVTGLSRDVSWGLYIAQFNFFGGVAASVAVVLIPAFLHNYKPFHKLVTLAIFMGIAAASMAGLFILVDLGQPQRMLNVMLHPSPNSMMFWDNVAIFGYMGLFMFVGWVLLEHERAGMEPPCWMKPVIILAVACTLFFQIVEGLILQGLPGRHYWLSAIVTPRFIASAFSAGPSILLLLCFLLKRLIGFDIGEAATRTMSKIITYAMALNVFFYLMEVFTAFYSGTPGHMHPIAFLFTGHEGQIYWINFWMWGAAALALFSLALLLLPSTRNNMRLLPWILMMLVGSAWIDKSLGMMIGGMTPNVFETITKYTPSLAEILICLGVLGIGITTLTIFWKIVLDVKKQAGEY
ncbi:polysulfide reductase NrfD [Desulfovibrio sp. OttesenSCG-928-C06]|nr:polysulfide reductase NrfD [Desulfovibrio sp. OttesenSCG-928-C06]